MRGIKEREEIWQGSPGCSLKEASVLQEKPSSRDELLLTAVRHTQKENTHKFLLFEMCICLCHAQNLLHNFGKLLKVFAWEFQPSCYPGGLTTGTRYAPGWNLEKTWATTIPRAPPRTGLWGPTRISTMEAEFAPSSHANSWVRRRAGASRSPEQPTKLLAQHDQSLNLTMQHGGCSAKGV